MPEIHHNVFNLDANTIAGFVNEKSPSPVKEMDFFIINRIILFLRIVGIRNIPVFIFSIPRGSNHTKNNPNGNV